MIKMKKSVVGFGGLYEVDSEGYVFSILQTNSRRKKELSQYANEGGYLKVNLYDLNGKCKKKYVHKIVAEAFLKNPNEKPIVNHIDCNRQKPRRSLLKAHSGVFVVQWIFPCLWSFKGEFGANSKPK